MPCYQCPLCHLPLVRADNYWYCAGLHRFDCAREGYVNLLPVQFKRSKIPGDNQDMMRSRRAFLDAGYYQLLRERVVGVILAMQPQPMGNWLDIGCGEGYYTAALAEQFPHGQVYGLDIAKNAIRAAAKRYPRVQFSVASSQRLPFNDQVLDGIVRIYAPCNPAEMLRTVKPGALMVTVAPGPRHLFQLKAQIYPQVLHHALKDEQFPGFTPVLSERLSYEMDLSGDAAAALLQMTPFAWRASVDLMARLSELPHFSCETDFIIRAWRRDGESYDPITAL